MSAAAVRAALSAVDTEGMLASQWAPAPELGQGYGPGSGPRRLMVAVLVDALRCAVEPARSEKAQTQQRLALRWITSESAARLFSFVRICQVLDLDVGTLRRGLRAIDVARLPSSRGRVGRSIGGPRPEIVPALEPRRLRRIYAGHRAHGPLQP